MKKDLMFLGLAVIIVSLIVAIAGPYKPGPEWKRPGVILPESEARVVGVYVREIPAKDATEDARYEAYTQNLFYLLQYGDRKRIEYWLEDDGTGGATACMGRPLYWATPEEAAVLRLPEMPDRYMEAMAR